MEFIFYNHLFAFIGSFATIITLLFMHKQRVDNGETRVKMKKYLSKTWDDFLYLTIIAQVIVLVQEYLITAYFDWRNLPDGFNWYIDHEELISFCVGVFGMVIFIKLFNMGNRKIQEHDL